MASNPEDVYSSTGNNLGGFHEIYTVKIGLSDDISIMQWEEITSNWKYRNIRTIVVAGECYKVLLWLKNSRNSFVNHKKDVKGIVFV